MFVLQFHDEMWSHGEALQNLNSSSHLSKKFVLFASLKAL